MNRICIIDSGYIKNHPQLNNIKIVDEISISKQENEIYVTKGAEDKIGHGTAVTSIIYSCSPNSEYYIIKIFDDKWECDEELLINSLHYIYDNIDCDYINISSGITTSIKQNELKQICDKFEEKNTLIVSAFDNNGAVSYPALFDNVIGVDTDIQCKNKNDFIHVKNSIVNVFGYGNTQRVAWTEPPFMFVSGSSFACAYITGYLANLNIYGFQDANKYLRNEAAYYIEFPELIHKKLPYTIINAITFPCNKETKGLVDNLSLLPFKLTNIYDNPKLGNVGKKLLSLDNSSSMVVKNINNINWDDDFDTVILGHMSDINRILGFDLRKDFVENCMKHSKNIFSYDILDYEFINEFKDKVYYPESIFFDNSFGKLYDISVPVLGVFGTSSKQGKFTLQLLLRKMFINAGYSVGQIGTEPSSMLYGIDETFHFGFNSRFNLSSVDFIKYINYTLNRLQNNNVDIVIGGCQSNTIPYSIKNTRYLNHRQSEFLTGLNPDVVILCVNPFDDFDYIERTIRFIESLTECKVISLVLYPLNISNMWAPNYRKSIDPSEAENLKKSLSNKFNIPCYLLGNEIDMSSLFNVIVDYYAEQEQ